MSYTNDANRLPAEKNLIEKELSYAINGALFRVHNRLGRYCNEQQYCDAIAEELKLLAISFEREKVVPSMFPGERPGRNRLDFLIEGRVPLEVKAKPIMSRDDYYQMRRYLAALNRKLGILVNFRQNVLRPKRILNSDAPDS